MDGRDRRTGDGVGMVLRAAAAGAVAAVAATLLVPVAVTAAAAETARPANVDWGASVTGAAACNPLGGSTCMVPFPSDYYTVVDRSMPSGRHVVFPASAMPANRLGMHISPDPYGRNDGFSPGSSILVHVAGLSLSRSHIPGVGDIGASLASDAGVVLLDETTGRRLPFWGELDVRDDDPANQLLMVHPAANLPEGHRIAVALVGVRTATGSLIAPAPAFAAVLRRGPVPEGVTGAFLDHERALVSYLAARGVPTTGLEVAWDFTVASTKNITGYAVHMRDVAMAQLHGGSPSFTVSDVSNFTKSQNGSVERMVTGTFSVPSFLDQTGGPYGSVLNLGPDGLPNQLPGNVQTAVFSCTIPQSASASSAGGTMVNPGRPVLYGVGLFGTATKLTTENVTVMADHYDIVLCATDWEGLTAHDELADGGLFVDLSNFPTLPDHLTQSMIDALYLGRLMSSPQGFDSSPDFRATGMPLIDTSDPLTYYGNSEGSIMGGALTAISTVYRRAVLGVPSMDYDVLLDRSVDAVVFEQIFQGTYPGGANEQVILDVLQMLFDRGETDGYAEQMTGGLPDTPSHQVLLQMAFGDHQVSNYTTVTEARTIGADMHKPGLAPGRFGGNLFWGIPALRADPSNLPATLYVWDPGVPAPPLADEPPEKGADPHQTVPRQVPAAQRQLVQFQLTGRVPNVCGPGPCVAAVHGRELTG